MINSVPLITIITPVYNASEQILRCIDNVQSQTFRNFIHLIIDGASTDNTLEFIKEAKNKSNNIEFISEKDAGVYDAMNKGIMASRSDWIYFLGCDDHFYDNKVLEKIQTTLRQKNTGIVYGDVYYQKYDRLYDGDFGIEKIITRNVCHQAVFYHYTTFNIVGIYNLKYRTEADYDLNLRCWISNEISILYLPLVIAYYSDGGISAHGRDVELVNDYPLTVVELIIKSNRVKFDKVSLLAIAYRKILLRYPLIVLKKPLFKRSFLAGRLFAFVWMIVSFPIQLFKKLTYADD